MLKRKNRFTLSSRLGNATTHHTPLFVLKVGKNNLGNNRYGFIVSKRISKSAVKRNRIKRHLRVCIEQNPDIIETGFDMLFIAKEKINNKTQKEIYSVLIQLLQKEGFLK